MAPRAYNLDSRQRQQAELKERIAIAAAQLHAAKGAASTSYAEIARAAGVSLPTVYKHFPVLDDLVRACSGHVAGQAPAFPAGEILSAASLRDAAEALVAAADRMNAYFEPWLSWREAGQIPVLAEIAARERAQLTGLIVQLLIRHGSAGDNRPTAAVWESLLNFELWHRLVRDHKLSRAAVRRTQLQLLLAVSGPQPAAPHPGPGQRKTP